MKSNFVTNKVPTSISESVVFVVNPDCLDVQEDILADDMGVWKNNGIDTTSVNVTFQDLLPKEVKKLSSKDVHSTKQVYRIHGTDQSQKITPYLYGEQFAK